MAAMPGASAGVASRIIVRRLPHVRALQSPSVHGLEGAPHRVRRRLDGGHVLAILALSMLACRFAHLELAAFARDEPQFLAAARDQLRTGHWLSANPLYGNLGLRYGPAALWFYGAIQALFGDAPRTGIVATGLAVTLSQLAFAAALTRLFDGDAAFFAALVALLASSPYEFLWSRLAW